MTNYLLQHGNYGQGAINPFLVSASKESLVEKVKSIIPPEFIVEIRTFFDGGNTIHITLSKPFIYSGFSYDMFFIDSIDSI